MYQRQSLEHFRSLCHLPRARRAGRPDTSASLGLPAAQWVRQALQVEPSAAQAEALEHTSRRLLVNGGPGAGKSALAIMAALHRAVTAPDSNVLVLTSSAAALWDRFIPQLLHLGFPCPGGNHHIRLPNGSRIGVTPHTDSVSSAHAVIADDAGSMADAVLASVLSRATGALWLLAAPTNGLGLFDNLWQATGAAVWGRVDIDASRNAPTRVAFVNSL